MHVTIPANGLNSLSLKIKDDLSVSHEPSVFSRVADPDADLDPNWPGFNRVSGSGSGF
jgi:hypothetical protein